MKTELILVGKTVNKHFIAGIKDYASASPIICLSILTNFLSSRTPESQRTATKEREGELILKLLQPSDTVRYDG